MQPARAALPELPLGGYHPVPAPVRRPRLSRIGAWASPQSQPIADRGWLEQRFADADARHPDHVPRPPHWGGYRLWPDALELWQGRPSRLHDRIAYRSTPSGWTRARLAP